MKQTQPGSVYWKSRLTEKRYREIKAVNKSTLWAMNKSPMHYKFACENPTPDTPALKMGRAIHAAVLQPKAFRNEWVCAPEIDRRTKEGKAAYEEFMTQAEGKEIISAADYAEVQAIAAAIHADPSAVDLLKGCTTEKPLFWRDEKSGLFCKCKVDAMKPGIMIDLKTSADASTKAFTRDFFKYGYDVQAAHYLDAMQTITGEFPDWYFIVIEKAAPYAINILKADTGVIDYGSVRRDELMKKLKECRAAKSWSNYGMNDLIMPGYMEG